MKSLALYYFELTLFIVYEFNLLFYFYFYYFFFERHQESERKLSVSMRVRALLLRIFNEIPLVHWNIDAQSTFGRGGKRQVKGQRRSCGICQKGQSMGNEPDSSEPLKSEASETGREVPLKNKAAIFSQPLCQKTLLSERRGLGRTLLGEGQRGGRGRAVVLWSSVCVLAKHVSRQEHGPLLHPALWNDFSFLGRAPINAQLTPCSCWALREASWYLCWY